MPSNVYVDTNILVRFIESDEESFLFLLENAASDVVSLFTSELTLAEVLVEPLREANQDLVAAYDELLQSNEFLTVVPIDRGILRDIARSHALLGNKGPDSIHVATADLLGCTTFVSSDRRIRLPDYIWQITSAQVESIDLWL